LKILCLDLEGVLIPEIWLGVADKTGIKALQQTTRDVPDYDELMTMRLSVLASHGISYSLITEVIDSLEPLPGAEAFLQAVAKEYQVAIVSDTFYQFAAPFMKKLGQPFLLCHQLEIGVDGMISNYHLRQKDPKRHVVQAFQSLNFEVIAAGDSFNDIPMLEEADKGYLFDAPKNVKSAYPGIESVEGYEALLEQICRQ